MSIEAMKALRQAIEQAEKQKPVAEAYALADKVRTELDKQSCPSAFMNIAWESVVKFHRDLIYITAPQPQHEWVGLTDADKDTTLFAMGGSSVDYIRGYESGMEAAEDKLKEKNT